MSDATVSSYFSNLFSSQSSRNALFLGSIAIGSSLATAAAIFGTQRLSRRKKRKDLGDTIRNAATSANERRLDPNFAHPRDESSSTTTDAGTPRYLAGLSAGQLRPSSGLRHSHSFNTSASVPPILTPSRKQTAGSSFNEPPEWDESLIREQLSRNYSFLGDQGMEHIRNSFVIVVGAGGVGSWAALMLLRSGVGKLRLIDFDQVSLSSLNRHACANLADVGRPKVVCCAEKFAQIAPWATLEAWVELFRGDEAERLLGGNPTYVIDAIDNIDTKVELLRYCAENKIKVISSMGAGAKSDPSRIQISDISTTSEDPLARSVRRRLRALGIPPLPPKEADEERADAKASDDAGGKKAKPGKAAQNLAPAQIDLDRTPVRGAAAGGPSGSASGSDAEREAPGSPNRLLGSNGAGKSRTPLVPSPLGGSPMQSPRIPPAAVAPMPNVRKAHSRRASSVSSFGSGAYATPLTTPSDEMAALLPADQQEGWAPLDGDDKERSAEDARPFTLDGSAQAQDEANGVDDAKAEEAEVEAQTKADAVRSKAEVPEDVFVDDDGLGPKVAPLQQPVIEKPLGGSGAPRMGRHASRTSDLEEMTPGSTTSSPAVSRSTSYRNSSAAAAAAAAATTKTTTTTTAAAAAAEIDLSGPPPEPSFFIPCVYSTEKSDTRLLPLDEDEFQKGSVDELAALEDFRVRILPVLGPLPAMFGLAVATYIICELAGHKMEPLAFKGRRKLYEKVASDLRVSESRYRVPGSSSSSSTTSTTNGAGGSTSGPHLGIPFNVNDVCYLFEEVFRGRSVVPPFDSLSQAQLERWDSTLPLSYSNVALFSRAQAKIHEREVLKKGRSPIEVWGSETARMVKRRMAEQRVSGFFR
ncbi:uncharacterized protein PFL1_04515 [Pseudozyma flocculosa PF-1]|uniref:THIF-type NAD/FAD binding fold domain-containing protein n=2 Tax=Pseudozyma flocculosa TaxID=84751 RepID=A0A5C3F9L0_9BASI|nr:uncharacterized protein PFL1_04515 [Pseudozyma flocculosa PF-1]EPQ27770.1 hypothetical protein PFL1_04515 [Pseudozyma flocculosa PF-1]SPO41104.1 uncharacterized protein PSFLO_06586 [Pseudozyma flocculosa]